MNIDYLAGFIDADGCIVIDNGTINIRVAQKNVQLLKEIQKVFGGKLAQASGKTGVYNVRWYGDEAVALGEALRGHLILKAAELEIMLMYAETRGIRGKHTSDEVKARRKVLIDMLKESREYRLQGSIVNGKFMKE